MAGAVHDQVGAVAADELADPGDALGGRPVFLDIHRRLGAKFARQRQARLLGRADADDAARAHLLRRGDGQDADRPGALDDDRVAPFEAAHALRAGKAADRRGDRLRQRAEAQRHRRPAACRSWCPAASRGRHRRIPPSRPRDAAACRSRDSGRSRPASGSGSSSPDSAAVIAGRRRA